MRLWVNTRVQGDPGSQGLIHDPDIDCLYLDDHVPCRHHLSLLLKLSIAEDLEVVIGTADHLLGVVTPGVPDISPMRLVPGLLLPLELGDPRQHLHRVAAIEVLLPSRRAEVWALQLLGVQAHDEHSTINSIYVILLFTFTDSHTLLVLSLNVMLFV